MMKLCLFLACFVAFTLAEDKYTDKYDNIDLEEIITNKRLLTAYINCIMDRGRCSPEGKELKEHLEDALQSGCSKCTKSQQEGSEKVIEHLIKNELAIWRELTDKFDPQGTYRKKYEDLAKEKGIEIPA